MDNESGKRKNFFEFIKKLIHDKVSKGELDIKFQIRSTVKAGNKYYYLDKERNNRTLSMRFYYKDSLLLEKYKAQVVNKFKKGMITPLKHRQGKSKELLKLFLKNNEEQIIFPFDKEFELINSDNMQYYAIIDSKKLNYLMDLYDNRTLAETIFHLCRLQTETKPYTYYCFNFEDIYHKPGKYHIIDGLYFVRNY